MSSSRFQLNRSSFSNRTGLFESQIESNILEELNTEKPIANFDSVMKNLILTQS